ncbi:hypothetical protein CIPAW_04G156900 [Carya illinoinensis]|uniref:Uncharacterized protein n=1 Tax=Carya illinoinensis TaxID=32201 RepID=A0A8T1QWT7_CARIL|nr:hypothetical protein CIPAW_04G156900 [Carya illinoinensis]
MWQEVTAHPPISEGDLYLPSPAVEIIPSKTAHRYKYAGENVDLHGLNMFKGRVSVANIIGFNGLEMISSKPDGGYLTPVFIFM